MTVSGAEVTISVDEYDRLVQSWIQPSRVRPSFPKRRKARLVALHRIRIGFDLAETYTEEQVNSVITARNLFDIDHVEIRRYLVDYGMVDRQLDGRSYWASDEYLNEAEWSPEIPGVGSRG